MKLKIIGLLILAALGLAILAGCGSKTGDLKVSVVDSAGNLFGALR